MGNKVSPPVKEVEYPSGEVTVMGHGGKLGLGKTKYCPVHSRPCSSCRKLIEIASESQPDLEFNCTECAEYVRKNLRDADCDEKSPPEPVTLTDHENKRANPQQTEMKIWKDAGHFEEFQLINKVLQGTEDVSLKDLFNKITSDLVDGKAGSVIGEIAYLSQNKRSCRVQVENQTDYTITCFGTAILGKQEYTRDHEIQSKQGKSYFFKKSNFSLKGCSGILTFTVEGSTLCFLVAFRNDTIQIRKKSCNKVAILRINDSKIKPDVCFFDKLMRNEESCPSFDDCCYACNDPTYPTFEATIAHETPNFMIKYDNIEIKVSMTHNFQSQVFVIVSSQLQKGITGSENTK